MTMEGRGATASSARVRRGEPLRFQPGEVCLVVETPPGAAEGSYERVRRQLNEQVRQLPLDGGEIAKSVFARDLRPELLRKYLAAGAETLAPLRIQADGEGLPSPSFTLPVARPDAPTVSLHYFQLPEPNDPRLVNEVVNLINLNRGRLGAGQAMRVLAATPNWLVPGAESFTEGGPGARPEPAPAGTWDLHFGNSTLVEQLAAGTGKGVVVAVLDTCPSPEVVAEAVEKRGNRLLKEVASSVKLETPPSLSKSYFDARLAGVIGGWRSARSATKADLPRFAIPDHGFFAAGLIRDMVPDAEVHILRVLNDYAIGDLLGLSWVLGQLPRTFLRDGQGQPNGKRLIVNLSLMADLPAGVGVRSSTALGAELPSNAFLRYWFPAASRSRSFAELRRHLQLPLNKPVVEAIRDTHLGLQQVVSALSLPLAGVANAPAVGDGDLRRRELLVAAAGNDSEPGQTPPPPRLPARYDSVFGVAAVNRKLAAAKYSNLGDDVQLGNAVSVFGGDATPGPNADDPNLINTAVPEGTVDAVVGVFSAPTFPRMRPAGPGRELPPPENVTGWAYWAGTSFATPIVSGLAASVWSAQPELSPGDVLSTVRSYATAGQQLAAPVIEADQVR